MWGIRWRIYAVIALAAILALLRWRSAAVDSAVAQIELRVAEDRLVAVRAAQRVRDDVEILDDAGLASRASRWLRETDR
jgi:hypothetical protein